MTNKKTDCPHNSWQRHGKYVNKSAVYQRYKCNDCGTTKIKKLKQHEQEND